MRLQRLSSDALERLAAAVGFLGTVLAALGIGLVLLVAGVPWLVALCMALLLVILLDHFAMMVSDELFRRPR